MTTEMIERLRAQKQQLEEEQKKEEEARQQKREADRIKGNALGKLWAEKLASYLQLRELEVKNVTSSKWDPYDPLSEYRKEVRRTVLELATDTKLEEINDDVAMGFFEGAMKKYEEVKDEL